MTRVTTPPTTDTAHADGFDRARIAPGPALLAVLIGPEPNEAARGRRPGLVRCAAVTGCGVIGLALVAAGASAVPVAAVSGVLPGALLLAFGWWGARWTPPAAGSAR
ncbi:MAG: hypothetical protein M3Z25_09635 [Actinomycetota bacterium]|nr:hypothetical protein [Actinomycetota bacterium]